MSDRHVTPRNYKSGAEKRKIQDDKNRKVEQVISKTSKISSFFLASSSNVACEKGETSVTNAVASAFCGDPALTPETVEENTNSNFEIDVGKWSKLNDREIDYWITRGSAELNYCDEGKFEAFSVCQERGDVAGFRKCSKSLFYRKVQSETIFRNWLCFSPSTGKLFCFVCKLMNLSVSSFSGEGFCNWKHAQEKLSLHETSKGHLESTVSVSVRAENLGVDQNLKREVSFFLQQENWF